MDDFQITQGFNDLWRAIGGRRVRGQGPAIAFRAQVTRMVRRAPEAIVGVTGAQKTRRALGDRLNYVSRQGSIVLEGADGERISGSSALRDVAEDWSAGTAFNSRTTKATPISRSLVFSTPPGSDREAVARGIRNFNSTTLEGRFEFFAARHDDTQCPHWHLIVRALGNDGTIFALNPDDLLAWREGFAKHLRQEGLELEATSRSARGISLKADNPRARHTVEAYEAGRVGEPHLIQTRRLEAERLAAGGNAALTPPELVLLSRRKQVRSALAKLAGILAGSALAEDRDLGRSIEAFLYEMPSAQTGRFRLAQQIAARELQQAINRMDREHHRDARLDRGRER